MIERELEKRSTIRMPWTDYVLVTLDDRPDLKDAAEQVVSTAWPKFILEDPIANRYWNDLYHLFPAFQFVLIEVATQQVVATGNSVPLAWDGSPSALPADGWDWGLIKAFEDQAVGRTPNALFGLCASIPPAHNGKGNSTRIVQGMKAISMAHGFTTFIGTLRPSLKHRYPLIPIERYLQWRDDTGLPFDPWLRVHTRLGAEVLHVCPRSMYISGSVAEWERWTGMRFPESGHYIVPGAQVPVEIDCARDQGIYVEPNVWIRHVVA